MRLPLTVAWLSMLATCATPPPPAPVVGEEPAPLPTRPPLPPVVERPAPPACTAFAAPGVLRRAALVGALDAGLGRWLAGVDVEPSIEKRRFRGWTVRRLHPEDPCFTLVDVRPGDVVLRVNGKPIERPEQASAVFEGLRGASGLTVDLVRDGEPRRIVLKISDAR